MNELIQINGLDLPVKEYKNQRVVTFKDIDLLHKRPEGIAKRNFVNNRKHFIMDIDYYEITREEFRVKFTPNEKIVGNPKLKVMLITESGYLMVVKSFTDNLAWDIQRQLVNSYFRLQDVSSAITNVSAYSQLPQEIVELLKGTDQTLTNFNKVALQLFNYTTINYQQQQELLKLVKERVNKLLGGAHSDTYKKYSRMYFKNLWLSLCHTFKCGTYKDLNPIHVDQAKEYIKAWTWKGKEGK